VLLFEQKKELGEKEFEQDDFEILFVQLLCDSTTRNGAAAACV
jgi:hypothetical protein